MGWPVNCKGQPAIDEYVPVSSSAIQENRQLVSQVAIFSV